MKQYLIAPRVFDGERIIRDAAVAVEGGRIAGLLPAGSVPATADCLRFNKGTLAPGFIDVQVNGGGGLMFNNEPTPETVEHIAAAHRQAGTTGIMPTLISDTPEVHRAGVESVIASRRRGHCGALGVHLEGPFLAPARRGAHREAMLRDLIEEDLQWLASIKGMPLMLTLAPERIDANHLRRLREAGVLMCAGHTEASYAQVRDALAEGVRGFTHLFNAMHPIMAREPGAVGAALEDVDSWVALIADGHHVHPANIGLVCRAKEPGKVFLVSDAMPVVGSSNTAFDLYGERIELKDGKLLNAEGILSGSAIGMIDAVRYCQREVGIALEECLRMASLYPAQFLGLDGSLGRIAENYRADMVLFDDDLNVLSTWVAGDYAEHSS